MRAAEGTLACKYICAEGLPDLLDSGGFHVVLGLVADAIMRRDVTNDGCAASALLVLNLNVDYPGLWDHLHLRGSGEDSRRSVCLIRFKSPQELTFGNIVHDCELHTPAQSS